jgi:lysophospholipase L1-like esterase
MTFSIDRGASGTRHPGVARRPTIRRVRFLTLTCLAAAACGGEPARHPDAGAAGILLVGRFERSDPAAPRFAWSGSTVRARFSAPAVAVELDEDGDGQHYAVVVDGVAAPAKLATRAGRHVYPLAADLPAGVHELELHRLTEAALGETRFHGLRFPAGGQLLAPPAAAPRRVLLVGDSISAGYGNEGADERCPFSPASENHRLAYGALAARALGAELTTAAWSGKGVFSNRGSTTDTVTMTTLWPRVLPAHAQPVADERVDAVWLNLGTNDLAAENPDWAPFAGAYLALVRQLRAAHPDAVIFCLLGPMLSDGWPEGRPARPPARAGIVGAVDTLRGEGDTRVHFVDLGVQDGALGYGCDWHPSLATHRALADTLVPIVRRTLAW